MTAESQQQSNVRALNVEFKKEGRARKKKTEKRKAHINQRTEERFCPETELQESDR